MADSSFALVGHDNCTIKVQFLFRYTSVATSLNKVFWVGLSGVLGL